ncbi:ChbG/HpnK family deacetylase [Paenibacillus sp. UASWS1643]|uniref:ChbG/HpnK family deacetylase n=1 Tax=Paenibacillus sp. UASWS1643 TaxID=2580422 RepID=UPI00123AA227|nr:ChbG/HpnK family deacetylase [Paenibacillus sp. UASWS1643]KAA8745360.1 ChbG/HpnK family deacetylase [Paenibacillus sp. UASWS1643]
MKLIVNADDFALTMGVTQGIIKGMKEGLITDTSVLVNAKSFDESIQLAKENGITSMGVHLTLTFSKPLLPRSEVKSIVDDHGDFFRKPHLIPKTYNKNEVYCELKAQIEKFLSTGMELNHLDTHHGFSALDATMIEVVTGLAKEYNVPLRRDDLLSDDRELKELFLSSVAGTDLTTHLYVLSGDKKEQRIVSILAAHKDTPDTVEIACHPGLVDEDLLRISSLTYEREEDLKAFVSEQVMAYVKDHHIELIRYGELK